MKNKIANFLLIAAAAATLGSCQKMDKPELGEVVTDEVKNLPEGPLRFFVDFNKTDGSSPRWNAADNISGNPALLFPSTYTQGVNGNAYQGKDKAAALYLNANDFSTAKSFTIAFWIKKAAEANRTEFLFSLVKPNFSWTSSPAFVLIEKETPTEVLMKFTLNDQWLEGTFKKPMLDGSWHHIAYVFDQSTLKMKYYFDGAEVTGLTATQTNVNGPVDFTGVTNMVIGGANTHAGLAGATGDWVNSFTGSLDQFRMYNTALPAADIKKLFDDKQ